MAKCFPLLPVSEKPVKGVPVVGPIWSGGINVGGSLSIKLDGMEIFMPKTSYSKVFKVKQSLQPSLWFSMKNRHSVWPEHFDELGAAHHDIDFFMFPEISRSDTAYDELVEYMISDDLAMTSHMGKIQLIIFTSLELEENQQQIQGKYYLWGMFKGKKFQNYKSSEGKKTGAKKGKISKCIRIGDLIPLLSPGCKRVRSNKRRISTTLNKEARNVQVENVCNTTVGKTTPVIVTDDDNNLSKEAEFTIVVRGDVLKDGLPNDEQNACGVDNRFTNQVAGRQSSDSNMEIDEPSDLPGVNNELEHANRGIIMEIDCHSDDAVKDLHPQSNVGLETDPEIKTCLTPFPNSKELPVSEVPNPAVIVERDLCSDASPNKDMILRLNECSTITGCVGLQPLRNVCKDSDLGIKTCLAPFVNSNVPTLIVNEERDLCSDENSDSKLCDTVNTSNQNDAKNMILILNEGSTGNGALKVDQPECRVADRLPELDSCRTPLVNYEEQARPSSLSSATISLEADEVEHELEEGEIPTKATKIFNEESEVITTSSLLKIVGYFHETTSDIVRVQVGRYTIKSDLAPFLTKVLDNHGDIALGCSIMPEVLLEEICKTFHDLESVPFSGLRSHHLEHLNHLCQLGKALDMDMKWLSKRCEDLEKSTIQISQYPFLKKEMDQFSEAIRSLEEKVLVDRGELLEDKQLIEKKLVSLKECQKQLHYETKRLKSETSRFLGKSVMDVLI